MTKKIMSNEDLENSFIMGEAKAVKGQGQSWEGKNPTAKRTGVKAYNIALNEYEKAVIDTAAAKEGSKSSSFIRQSALKRAKIILGID